MRTLVALSLFTLFTVAVAQQSPSSGASCDNCGVVQSIQMTTEQEQWTPLGVVSPGTALTATNASTESRSVFAFDKTGKSQGLVVIGAAGGAVYAKKPNQYQKPRWDVTVKMDNGSTRVVQQRYEPLYREGDRVRIFGSQIEVEI
jgi:outer membrane lipoprotein SlyB